MTKLVSALLLFMLLGLAAARAADERRTILFFGDSLTAGYGLPDPLGAAFPALIQERIDAAGLPYRVINAGLSGETTAGGLRRIDWILRQPIDVFVLELGGNDGLRGLPVATMRQNLQATIDRVLARNPHAAIVIAGMRMPPSMGAYAREFDAVFPHLAEANRATYIPHLLEGVGGIPELNLPDGIHPTEQGHRIVAETLWQQLEPLLRSRASK